MSKKGKITVDEQELKKKLTPEQYHILREKGTEAPFTSSLLYTKDKGIYACAACGNPLFRSGAKFDSGSGWPSFDQALPAAVEFQDDDSHGMHRIEVTCSRCGSHLGHVFDDGPSETTGKRYCINGACLVMQKQDAQEAAR
jgi:peptide-methionine (R)-S-oxide reductase